LTRRLRLLDWAAQEGAWVIEDDYLGELQLKGRATPALASLDRAGRVIHIGSFSKTISPAWRLGFVVAPTRLASRFAEVAACLGPAPGTALQRATAMFMREGYYLRHLRRTKRVYSAQRDALLECLQPRTERVEPAGLAVLLWLPAGAQDQSIARELVPFGLAPTPLSIWYASPASAPPGLLLGVATAPQKHLARSCDRLCAVIERLT
jgi:GntR family transcriptional regulator/MocR family aminotransferase